MGFGSSTSSFPSWRGPASSTRGMCPREAPLCQRDRQKSVLWKVTCTPFPSFPAFAAAGGRRTAFSPCGSFHTSADRSRSPHTCGRNSKPQTTMAPVTRLGARRSKAREPQQRSTGSAPGAWADPVSLVLPPPCCLPGKGSHVGYIEVKHRTHQKH